MIADTHRASDASLMDGVNVGNVEAFATLYDRYCHRAYSVALSVCRDDGRAQDAVQDAFLSIWNSRARYHPQRGTVAAWLLTVVRYRAIDLTRSNRRHEHHRAGDEQLACHAGPDDLPQEAINRDDADQLQASLALLPVLQEQVITLAFYGQLTHTEIATQLALRPGTVKGRMRLGLQKLRADIDQPAA
ncbi:MAG TPA: sigma-70 family RNA polymerase sigma factor [Solirubrobacteraceae bacterium]